MMEASDCSPHCSCGPGAHRLLTEGKFDPPAKILTVPFGQKRIVGILRMHNKVLKVSFVYVKEQLKIEGGGIKSFANASRVFA